MSLPSAWEENEGGGDDEFQPSDFLSHGLDARSDPHEKETVSPIGVIDAFVPIFTRKHSLADSDSDQSSLMDVNDETSFDFADLETKDTAVALLPDFTSVIDPSHDDYNLPMFGRITESAIDDADADHLLERQLTVPNSPLEASLATVASTPFDSHHDPQEPLPLNHMLLFDNDTLLPGFGLQPTDSVLRHLDFGYPDAPSSGAFSPPSFDSSGVTLPNTFQPEANMETTSAFQRTFAKADESSLDSPPPPSSIQSCEELRDCPVAQAASLQESEEPKDVPAVAENPTKSKVNSGSDASGTLLKSNETAAAKTDQQRPPYRRFSSSVKDPIFLSLDQVKDDDVFSGKRERASAHPGNIKYRGMVAEKSPTYRTYASGERNKKTRMRNEIIQKLGGRFVDWNSAKGLFQVLTRNKVNAKVSQALRDGCGTKKKKVAAARRRKRQSKKSKK